MSRRVLVLGGGGFLGGHLARWLAVRGHCVRIFDLRLPDGFSSTEGPPIELVEGNFFNAAALAAALDGGIDLVLHFISTTVPASSIDNVLVEIESNVAATARLLDLMARRGIQRIGFPSSGGTVYGAGPEAHVEHEPPRPTCPHGLGKLLIESMLRFYHERRGIEYQIWRIANPYGDGSKLHTAQGAIDAFLHRVRVDEPISIWGDGSAVRDFVFADDVAAAIGLLLEGDAWGETVNVGSGHGTSIAEVVGIIESVVDRRVQVHRVEGYTGPPCAVLDSSKLRRLTGWAPAYDLPSGIAEAWRRLNR
jgi:UDP-glucose 4-epimerase